MNQMRFILALSLFYSSLFAVINSIEDSNTKINNISSDFQSTTLPEVNVELLLAEDQENTGIGVPIRIYP